MFSWGQKCYNHQSETILSLRSSSSSFFQKMQEDGRYLCRLLGSWMLAHILPIIGFCMFVNLLLNWSGLAMTIYLYIDFLHFFSDFIGYWNTKDNSINSGLENGFLCFFPLHWEPSTATLYLRACSLDLGWVHQENSFLLSFEMMLADQLWFFDELDLDNDLLFFVNF